MIKKIIIGFIAGFISGLFASGGGLILLPACIYFLGLNEKEARGTTIFSVLPMVIVTAISYQTSNLIDWSLGIRVALGGMVGGFIGSICLKKMKSNYLKIIFIIFLVYASVSLFLR